MKKTLPLLFLLCMTAVFGLKAQTELPNPSFETWIDTLDHPKPAGWWESHNRWGLANNIDDWAVRRTFLNVHEGLFAAELQTKIGDVFTLDIFRKYIPGVLTNGECDLPISQQLVDELSITHSEFITGGEAFEGMLDRFKGWYDYTPVAGDSAYVYLKLWKNDGTVVGTGELFITANTSDYTEFEVPINYTVMEEPDSLLLIIASSYHPRAANVGSRLFIDNLSFEFTDPNFVDSYAAQHGIAIRLFPNPATSSFFLENPYRTDVHVEIYNAMGQMVQRQSMIPGLNEISLQGLASGTHLYRMVGDGLLIASGNFVIR